MIYFVERETTVKALQELNYTAFLSRYEKRLCIKQSQVMIRITKTKAEKLRKCEAFLLN